MFEFMNNPGAVISEIDAALSKTTAGQMSVETVRLAKQILNGSVRSDEPMKAKAQQLKDKLHNLSSDGRDLWSRA